MMRLSRNVITRSSGLIGRCEWSASLQTIAAHENTSSETQNISANQTSQDVFGVKDELHASKLRSALSIPAQRAASPFETAPSERQRFLELFRLHNSSLNVAGGHMIKARVLNIDKKRILLDAGTKYAKISFSDLTPGCILHQNTLDTDLNTSQPRQHPGEVRVGDTIQVYLEHQESPEGDMLVSGQQAAVRRRVRAVWKELQDRLKDGKPIKGRILNAVSGGYSVGVAGLVCFLPIRSTARSTAHRIGELQDFKVVQMTPSRNNVVLVDCRMAQGLDRIMSRRANMARDGGGNQRQGNERKGDRSAHRRADGETPQRWKQQQQHRSQKRSDGDGDASMSNARDNNSVKAPVRDVVIEAVEIRSELEKGTPPSL